MLEPKLNSQYYEEYQRMLEVLSKKYNIPPSKTSQIMNQYIESTITQTKVVLMRSIYKCRNYQAVEFFEKQLTKKE